MRQRIAYIDALRGFSMFLVVYSHVLLYSFNGRAIWSLGDLFYTFMIPLFFAISGYMTQGSHQTRTIPILLAFIQKKGRQLLCPTILFSLVYAVMFHIPYSQLLFDKAKCGYWFTYTLFFYFLIYAISNTLFGRFFKEKTEFWISTLFSCLVFAFAKYSLSPTCPWFNSPINGMLGFANFQYYIFFFLGTQIRCYKERIKYLLKKELISATIVSSFLLLQFLLLFPASKDYIITTYSYSAYSLIRSISSFFSIGTLFIFFHKNELLMLHTRFGQFLQCIGKRTLDIYLIHTILVRTNLQFVGQFLSEYGSTLTELILGGVTSLIIIALCLLISQFIHCNDTLTKLFFGKTNNS